MRPHLIWEVPQKPLTKILVESSPLEAMDLYRQNAPHKPEAGGIILGYRRDTHLHVTQVTIPQVDDKRHRYGFHRSAQHHQQVALKAWHASGKTMDYLGDWHTHPELHPSPSGLDLNEWKKICSQRKSPMLFMILGVRGDLWVGLGDSREITRCVASKN
ncbi:hypothetical protein F7R01_16865 [Pseudomonas argentinensis]|uniref:Mov34/MPN/PAD-1 family protein n=2 Tax=Phytopseudomonas argentinensis TaxID=289370 RepID=UPI000942A6B2|nr:hypothetical protein F7R01_16865 [Pseudomonas argentinensis]